MTKHEEHRERLLHLLSEAPLEILLGAVEDYKSFKIHQSDSLNAVFKFFGDGKKKVAAQQEEPSVAEPTKTEYITPPGTPAGKIGSETEAAVMAHLRSGPDKLQNLAVAMKRNEAVAETLLARLCAKGKIGYRSDKLYCSL